MGCGRCGQVAVVCELSTPPTASATRRWVTFRLSDGYFFGCQGSDETAQVGHFSAVKWVLFELTKTSNSETNELTHHAMLIAWGEFAHSVGLIQEIESVPLRQKTVTHRPQTKILEFLVAILAGLEYLKDLSRSAHPIDQDQTVAKAWGQPA